MYNLRGFFFDLDGTIYAGNKLIDGASDLLSLLHDEGKTIAFITNNSTLNAIQIKEKLAGFGVSAHEDQIICPTDISGSFIKKNFGPSTVYVIGSDALKDNVTESGHTLCEDLHTTCDVVLVGRDLEFSYRKLEDASIHVQNGAHLVATNMDHTHPIHTGDEVPETGALVAAIQTTVKVEPMVIGKPHSYIFDYALSRFNLSREETALIGDNPLTDILGGMNAGLQAVLINGKRDFDHTESIGYRTVEALKDIYDEMHQSLVSGGSHL